MVRLSLLLPSGEIYRGEAVDFIPPMREVKVLGVIPNAADQFDWYLEHSQEGTELQVGNRTQDVLDAMDAWPGRIFAFVARSLGSKLEEVYEAGLEHAFAPTEGDFPQVHLIVEAHESEWFRYPWEMIEAHDSGIVKSVVRLIGPTVAIHAEIQERDELRILLANPRPNGADDVPKDPVELTLRAVAAQFRHVHVSRRTVSTFDSLKKELLNACDCGTPYDVLHFDGHGDTVPDFSTFLASGGPHLRAGLAFEPDGGRGASPNQVSGEALGKLCAESGVEIVFLNACRSGQLLGEELIQAGVSDVVCMSHRVGVSTVPPFLKSFYGSLFEGQSIATSAGVARSVLRERQWRNLPGVDDWMVPIVLTRSGTCLRSFFKGDSTSSNTPVVPDVTIDAAPGAEPNETKGNVATPLSFGAEESEGNYSFAEIESTDTSDADVQKGIHLLFQANAIFTDLVERNRIIPEDRIDPNEVEEALDFYNEAFDIFLHKNRGIFAFHAEGGAVQVLVFSGDVERAKAEFEKSRKRFMEKWSEWKCAVVNAKVAHIWYSLGEFFFACRALNDARETVRPDEEETLQEIQRITTALRDYLGLPPILHSDVTSEQADRDAATATRASGNIHDAWRQLVALDSPDTNVDAQLQSILDRVRILIDWMEDSRKKKEGVANLFDDIFPPPSIDRIAFDDFPDTALTLLQRGFDLMESCPGDGSVHACRAAFLESRGRVRIYKHWREILMAEDDLMECLRIEEQTGRQVAYGDIKYSIAGLALEKGSHCAGGKTCVDWVQEAIDHYLNIKPVSHFRLFHALCRMGDAQHASSDFEEMTKAYIMAIAHFHLFTKELADRTAIERVQHLIEKLYFKNLGWAFQVLGTQKVRSIWEAVSKHRPEFKEIEFPSKLAAEIEKMHWEDKV